MAIAALATMSGRGAAQGLATLGTPIPPVGPGTAITTVGQAVQWAQAHQSMEIMVGTIAADAADSRLIAPNTPGSSAGRVRDSGGTVGVILQSPPLEFTAEELIGLIGAAALIAAGLGWVVGNRRRSTNA
jgi:hypothetical protein